LRFIPSSSQLKITKGMFIMSKIKIAALSCLSMITLTSLVAVPTANAGEHRYSYEDVRGYDRYDHGRGSHDSFYQVRNNRRLCRELRESIYYLERTREQILRRHHYNPERLRWIERELRQKRAEYRRACR
jgi:hypothetical protein